MPDEYIFPTHKSPKIAVISFAKMFRYHMIKSPLLNVRKESTPNRFKISLYSFKDFGFTRAEKMFDVDYARELKGDKTTQYSNYTIEEKMEMYMQLEPELTIFNADKLRKELDVKYQSQTKAIEELKKQREEDKKELTETKLGVALLKPLLSQLAKESKTKKFTFTAPDGSVIGSVSLDDLEKQEG